MANKLPPHKFIDVVRDTPLVSIDLVARDPAGRVLVGYRANAPARHTWFVPGGRICKDERIADAFWRLTGEELGVPTRIEHGRFLGVFEHLYPDSFMLVEGITTHYVVLGYELTLDPAPEHLPREQHGTYKWMTPGELLAAGDVHENTKAYFQGAASAVGGTIHRAAGRLE